MLSAAVPVFDFLSSSLVSRKWCLRGCWRRCLSVGLPQGDACRAHLRATWAVGLQGVCSVCITCVQRCSGSCEGVLCSCLEIHWWKEEGNQPKMRTAAFLGACQFQAFPCTFHLLMASYRHT